MKFEGFGKDNFSLGIFSYMDLWYGSYAWYVMVIFGHGCKLFNLVLKGLIFRSCN